MAAIKNKNKIKIIGLLILILCGLLFFNEIVDTVYALDNYSITYDANGGGVFSNGNTENVVTYGNTSVKENRISKTANVSDDGNSYSGGYGNSKAITNVVTIPGATELKVTITYATEHVNYDWVCVYDGSATPSASNYSNSISGKLGGSKTTKTFTVPGDTVKFFFRSDSSVDSYFGYYAVVESETIVTNIVSGNYEDVSATDLKMRFVGWYTDANCTDGNEFNLNTISSDITVYAKYERYIFDVTYDANDGGVFNDNSGQNVVVYEMSKEGVVSVRSGTYESPTAFDSRIKLDAWYTDAECTDGNEFDVTTLSSDITIYAKYRRYIFDVTYDANGNLFAHGGTQNTVTYEDPKNITLISKTSNVSDDGSSYSGKYPYVYSGINDVITIPGATELKVTITYQTYSTSYDWVCVYDGSITPSSSNSSSSISGKLGGTTKNTKTYTVEGDTVQLFFVSTAGSMNYYGYYAVVEGAVENVISGTYENPVVNNSELRFADWYTDSNCTDGNEFDFNMISSDITVYAKYEDAYLASGICDGVSWKIYEGSSFHQDGLLKIYPTDGVSGTLADNTDSTSDFWPWYNYCDSITKVIVEDGVIANTNASYLFSNFKNCTEIDLVGLNISNVTNMDSMFKGCNNLISLDLSSFNTSNTTNMHSMFNHCNNLTSLDLSNFNTLNVTNMSAMFLGCWNLTSLDLSNFNTINVTNMGSMFSSCSDLTSLDLSNFNTINVTNMGSMFMQCSSLISLDLSSFNTLNVTDMRFMFDGCNSLQSLDVTYFDTSKVTLMYYMFNGCGSLASLDLSSFNTTNVTNMEEMFKDCNNLVTLDLSNFNTNNVTNMYMMFRNCTSLASLDLSSFNTTNVTNMSYMFSGCGSLASLDLSSFNTAKVTGMNSMFNGCSSLTSLDLSSFNIRNSVSMSEMFSNMTSLSEISIADSFSFKSHHSLGGNWIKSKDIDGKDIEDLQITSASNFPNLTSTTSPTIGGTWILAPTYSWEINNEGILRIYPTNGTIGFLDSSTGISSFWPWYPDRSNITKVVVEGKIIGNLNLSFMFFELSNCTEMDLSGLDTSNVTDMRDMFYKCRSLTSLDLSNFNTSNTIYTKDIFNYCDKLNCLILNDNLTKSSELNGLASSYWIKIKNIDGTDVMEDIELHSSVFLSNKADDEMIPFEGTWIKESERTSSGTHYSDITWEIFDNGLLRIYPTNGISGNLSNNTNAPHQVALFWPWYNYRNSVTKVIIEDGVGTTQKIGGLFEGMSNCIEMDLSGLSTSFATDFSRMFMDCTSLVSLDLSNFNTNNVTTMSAMFYNCNSLQSLNISSFNTSNVTNMQHIFYNCTSLISLDLSNFNTSNITNMSLMFYGCNSLTELDLSSFNTFKVTNMKFMFYDCNSLISLNLSSFDTSKVTNMGGMFYDCNSLTSLDLINFDTSSLITIIEYDNSTGGGWGMFGECHNLISLNFGEKCNFENVTDMRSMFDGCSSLTNLDLSNFNTSNVTNMQYMFDSCNSLQNLNLSSFNTSNVTTMYNMFRDCNSLTNLDLNSFNTLNVTNMQYMFYNCSSLQTLDLNSFNTSNASMNYMLYYCDSLETLILGDEFIFKPHTLGYQKPTYGAFDWSYGNQIWKWEKIQNEDGTDVNNSSIYETTQVMALSNSTSPTLAGTWNITHHEIIAKGDDKEILWHILEDGTLRIYPLNGISGTFYDKISSSKWDWYDYRKLVIKVSIDEGVFAPSNASYMFSDMSNCLEMDLSNLDTSNTTDMTYIIDCSPKKIIFGEKFISHTIADVIDRDLGLRGMAYRWKKIKNVDGTDTNDETLYDFVAISKLTDQSDPTINGTWIRVVKNSGICGGCTWEIDFSNNLKIYPTDGVSGTLISSSYASSWPWYSYRNSITSVFIEDGVIGNSSVSGLFEGMSKCTQMDLSGLDTSNVTNISSMFGSCSSLTSLDLSNFDTSNVGNMYGMFKACSSLKELDLSSFDTSKVTDMHSMFSTCSRLTGLNLSNFDTSNVTKMHEMFYQCSSLTNLDLSSFDTSNVTNMSYMFYSCDKLTSLDLSGLNTSKVTDMNSMFYECSNLTSLDLSNFDTSNVTNMSYMFYDCTKLTSLDLSGFNTSNVTYMSNMFNICNSLASLDLSGFNTDNVTNMDYMFSYCSSLTNLDLSNFNTSKVTNMMQMFSGCSSLTTLDLSNFNTSKVGANNMQAFLNGCSSLEVLNLSNLDIAHIGNAYNMFNNLSSLRKIIFTDDFEFHGTNHGFASAGDNWVKVRTPDGAKVHDTTEYTALDMLALTGETTPTIGGIWMKYGATDFITNPDGSIEYISENDSWNMKSDTVWTYSFKVFDDTLIYYLFEEVIDGYISEAMSPYYITIQNNMATITNKTNEIEESNPMGKLIISKTVEGITSLEEFAFTIQLSGENISGTQTFNGIVFKNGLGKFYLSHGYSKEFDLPAGITYVITETPNLNYTSTMDSSSGTIIENTINRVNVVNTYIEPPEIEPPIIEPELNTVNITLKKTASNYDILTTGFAFNGYFTGLEANKEYRLSNGSSFTASNKGIGFCEVTLMVDEEVVFLSIPEHATYQFTELAGKYTSSYTITNNSTSGNIIMAQNANVESNTVLSTEVETVENGEEIIVQFHNDIETVQNLTISKVTQKEIEDGSIVIDDDVANKFEFTINFSNMQEGNSFTSTVGKVIADEYGEATKTFYLMNGENAEFYNIPVGVKYQVIETANNSKASYTVTGINVTTANNSNAETNKNLSTSWETIDANEIGIVTFINTKIAKANIPIHLTKSIDTQGHDPILIELANNRMYTLDGAEYEIIVDGEVVETLVTDINGQATSTQVFENGTTGIIREIKAPDGFLLDETEYSFTIDTSNGDAYCEVAVSDVPTFDPTVFRFKKTAAGTGVAQGNTTFEGAVFKYEYFDNTNWSGTPVRTWYFETDVNGLHRYHTDYLADGYTSDELYTDTTGIYTFPLGSVKITEVVSPLGYKELPVMYATITQPAMGADAKWQFTPETIAFLRTASNDMYEGDEPIDETKLGSLIVEKIDRIYLSDVSDITFAGCEFTIYNMSTNPVKIGDNPIANNGEACMTIVVGEDGKAITGAVLPIGTYVVKETKGNEYYECNIDFSYEFTIHGDEENEIIEVSCFNQIKAPISFIKTDENGNPLAGAKLQIKDAEGNVVDEWTSTTEAHISRLAGGTYTLHEKMPPLSYWWAEDFEFIVHTSDIGFVQLVDNDGTPVIGAEVELKLGETVCKTVTTDYQGRFTMNKFDRIGGYTVHMVDVPDGYNFGENNDFRFRMYSTDTDSLETESDNLIILDYVPIEEGDNGENPSSTVDVDEMSVTMVDKKFVHMVSSGGTGTVITVVLAAVFGCIAGGFIYIGKKKSKEDKNSNKAE